MTAIETIRARALATPMRITEVRRLEVAAWFDAHPGADDCYLCYDGRVLDGDAYRRGSTSRTACLVAILCDGFPMNLSRWAVFHRRGST